MSSADVLQPEFRYIGQPLLRSEDERLLRGEGRFSDDFHLPGQAYAAVVRSPYPHAVIEAMNSADARALPGVLAVLTGTDCQDAHTQPLDHKPLPKTRYDLKLEAPGGGAVFAGVHTWLPVDRVRHVGEGVAVVVGDTLAAALEGAEAVNVTYRPLASVSDGELAVAAGAPSVWDQCPGNVLVDTWFGNPEATAAAFNEAAHVVETKVSVGRVTGVPLEPRVALGHYDGAADRYTLYAGSGGAVKQKYEIAAALGIDPASLRVICLDVGGNFGTRNRVYVEYGLALLASRVVGRPVKFVATRSEAFLTDYQGRDLKSEVALAIDANGRFLAMRASNLSNVGSHCVSLSPLGKGSALVTGPYRIPAASLRARATFSHTMPTQAYRSSGRPEVVFALERLVDKAAAQCGFDPVELRQRNLVPPDAMPYTNAVGATYDSGDYRACFDAMLTWADVEGFPSRKAKAESRQRCLGLAVVPYVESSVGSPVERSEITIGADGHVEVVIGTQPSGQGHETSFAQVAADLLCVPYECVRIVMGDTDRVTVGGGSHSGRSMRHAATVMAKSVAALTDRGRTLAALVFGIASDAVRFHGGVFSVPDTNFTLDWFGLARALQTVEVPDGLGPGLTVVTDNEMHDPVFPNGAAACEVEVDPETGEVTIVRYAAIDDVGRCINPLIVDGQTHGAIAQGVGQALLEAFAVDAHNGQPISGSLMDYALPRADNLPTLHCEIAEVLSPTNPLGIKAGGEGGTTPALAVVVGAVTNALSGFGVEDIEMPLTPFTVWKAIRAATRASLERDPGK